MDLTLVVCTHNRAELLERTLNYLNQAKRPANCRVEILVIPNACTDTSHALLQSYQEKADRQDLLPLRWEAEATPGKSHALNRAIPLIQSEITTFVDDDHRVDTHYLTAICQDTQQYPDIQIFCGRILPDWDGREPAWAHDPGPFALYPLPVPRYDQGPVARIISGQGPRPGGGNLILRTQVFQQIGGFNTKLGPQGHNLGGGEDSDFIGRAIRAGNVVQYLPSVIQYHYVDPERMRLGYVLQKSYQRSRSINLVDHHRRGVPRYLWRKLLGYLVRAAVSLYWPATRFYLVRTAATLGEISAGLHGNKG